MGQIETFDSFYDREELSFGGAPTRELKEFVIAHDLKGRALDLGSGDGRNSLFLA